MKMCFKLIESAGYRLSTSGQFFLLLSIAPGIIGLSSHDTHSSRTSLRLSSSNISIQGVQTATSSKNPSDDGESSSNLEDMIDIASLQEEDICALISDEVVYGFATVSTTTTHPQ